MRSHKIFSSKSWGSNFRWFSIYIFWVYIASSWKGLSYHWDVVASKLFLAESIRVFVEFHFSNAVPLRRISVWVYLTKANWSFRLWKISRMLIFQIMSSWMLCMLVKSLTWIDFVSLLLKVVFFVLPLLVEVEVCVRGSFTVIN